MSWLGVLGNIFGGGIKHYSDYKTVTRKKELELANKETDLAKFRSAQQDGSWKDELLTILIFAPWILILLGMIFNFFIASWIWFIDPIDVQPYLDQFFSLIEGIPTWYRWIMSSIIGSVFGFKVAGMMMKGKK